MAAGTRNDLFACFFHNSLSSPTTLQHHPGPFARRTVRRTCALPAWYTAYGFWRDLSVTIPCDKRVFIRPV